MKTSEEIMNRINDAKSDEEKARKIEMFGNELSEEQLDGVTGGTGFRSVVAATMAATTLVTAVPVKVHADMNTGIQTEYDYSEDESTEIEESSYEEYEETSYDEYWEEASQETEEYQAEDTLEVGIEEYRAEDTLEAGIEEYRAEDTLEVGIEEYQAEGTVEAGIEEYQAEDTLEAGIEEYQAEGTVEVETEEFKEEGTLEVETEEFKEEGTLEVETEELQEEDTLEVEADENNIKEDEKLSKEESIGATVSKGEITTEPNWEVLYNDIARTFESDEQEIGYQEPKGTDYDRREYIAEEEEERQAIKAKEQRDKEEYEKQCLEAISNFDIPERDKSKDTRKIEKISEYTKAGEHIVDSTIGKKMKKSKAGKAEAKLVTDLAKNVVGAIPGVGHASMATDLTLHSSKLIDAKTPLEKVFQGTLILNDAADIAFAFIPGCTVLSAGKNAVISVGKYALNKIFKL